MDLITSFFIFIYFIFSLTILLFTYFYTSYYSFIRLRPEANILIVLGSLTLCRGVCGLGLANVSRHKVSLVPSQEPLSFETPNRFQPHFVMTSQSPDTRRHRLKIYI